MTAGRPEHDVERANTVPARTASMVDAAEVLTERLAHLGDAAVMRTLLQQALDDLWPQAFTVEGYAIDHCKVTPWREIAIALSLMLRSTRTGEQSRQIVAGIVFATVDEARRHLQDSRAASESHAASMALVPEMAMVIRPFPFDARLRGLSRATDTTTITALLAAHLPECRDQGWRIRDVVCEPLQYKPGRLCTLRYTVTLDRAGTLDEHRVEVYGKVYRDDRWQPAYALLEATWQASIASGGTWAAAQPVAAVDSWRLIMQRAVRGRQFRHVLGDLTTDAVEADLRDAKAHLAAVARAVHGLQQAPIALGSWLDFRALLNAQRDNLSCLHQVHPPLARELQQVRAAIERLADTTPVSTVGFAHGDFAHGNVLVDAGRVGIIDFDRAGQAEAAYDAAYFLSHLSSFALRHRRRAAHVRRLCEHFRETFCALAGVSPQRLAVYEALDLSAYVLRNFRKRSHQPEWIGWATGQIAAAWDCLEAAA